MVGIGGHKIDSLVDNLTTHMHMELLIAVQRTIVKSFLGEEDKPARVSVFVSEFVSEFE